MIRNSCLQTNFNIMAEGKRPDNAQKLVNNLLIDAENQLQKVLMKKTIEQILEEMNH